MIYMTGNVLTTWFVTL